MNTKIDFVITWVDGSDPEWLHKKTQYMGNAQKDMNSSARYRDWELLIYWFRSVEKYAPWVNKIYFITEGHIPDWLNVNYDKLVVVKHSDYILDENLPTFNSNVIELNLHKIQGLSENFVNFNDDMFLNSKTSPEDFFGNGIPLDSGIFSPIVPLRGNISSIILNNVEVINDYFTSRNVIKNHFKKFFSLKYGKHLIKNFCVLPWRNILGFYDNHIPVSYNKNSFKIIWDKEKELLEKVSQHKFRTKEDINHWVIRYWQLCSGNFIPRETKFGCYYNISNELDRILEDIEMSKHKVICLNDSDGLVDFDKAKFLLIEAFKKKYNEKSKFEK